MRTASGLGIAVLVFGVGAILLAQPPAVRTAWPIADAPPELRESLARADLIVASMQNALLRELTRALAQGGPAHAVQACHIEVAGLTGRIGLQAGVKAGGTSDRAIGFEPGEIRGWFWVEVPEARP